MLSESAPGGAHTGVRERQREATRLRLLDAALDEFLEHGYGGASTRRVTAAAGVSHGLLFHHYASKAELYAELVRLGAARVTVDRDAALADPVGHFTATATWVLTTLREDARSARMFVFMDQALARPALVPEVEQLLLDLDVVRASVPAVEAGQRAGDFRAGSAQALAVLFWAALNGVAQEAHTDPSLDLPEPDWVVDVLRGGSVR